MHSLSEAKDTARCKRLEPNSDFQRTSGAHPEFYLARHMHTVLPVYQQGRVNQRWDTGQQKAYSTASSTSTHRCLLDGLTLENSICEARALKTAVPGAGSGAAATFENQPFRFRRLAGAGTARCLWHTRSTIPWDCILCINNLIA